MSEQSGGPGWWQASDGKWYPPEQAPSAAPTAPVPETPAPGGFGGPPPAGPPGGGPPPYVAPAGGAGGGSNTGKIVAIVVVVALVAGGIAFALTRDSGSSGGSTASFCTKVKSLQKDADLNKAFEDPSQIDKAVSAFQQLTDAAPSEIKADMNTINDAVKKIGAAVKSAGKDPSKQFGAIIAASAGIDQKKVEQAQSNVEKFAKDKCGVDLNSGSSGSSSSSRSSSSRSSSSESGSFGSDLSDFSSFLSDFSSSFGSDFFSSFGSDFFSSGN